MKKTHIDSEALSDRIDYLLANSGFHLIPGSYYSDWPAGARAFEDPYTMVGIWIFDSFEDLAESWMTAQDAMIRLVSTNVLGTDSKSWDGYLILGTGASVPAHLTAELDAIRLDTRRIRKLVVTAEDLETSLAGDEILNNIRRTLAPVVAIRIERSDDSQDPLETLPQRLENESDQLISDLRAAVNAYKRGIPALDAFSQNDNKIVGESLETQ